MQANASQDGKIVSKPSLFSNAVQSIQIGIEVYSPSPMKGAAGFEPTTFRL